MKTLKQGDVGKEVVILQKLLNSKAPDLLTLDGQFGKRTHDLVMAIQKSYGLVQDGVVGPSTWQVLNNTEIKSIAPADFKQIIATTSDPKATRIVNFWNTYGGWLTAFSNSFAIDKNLILSTILVESSGQGLNEFNRPTVRFELHWFHKFWGVDLKTFNTYFYYNPVEKWKEHSYRTDSTTWLNVHTSQLNEETAMAWAGKLADKEKVANSTSMGFSQIMGFHHKRLGYPDAVAMYKSSHSLITQLLDFFTFIKTDVNLLESLQLQDLDRFIKIYNGSGQIQKYKTWILEYQELAKALL